MLKLVVAILLLAACCAQEHLTCLRTDQILTQSNHQPGVQRLQGRPGKLGPKGATGPRGRPGSKGEPGVSDQEQIDLFREQLISLSRKVERLERKNREIINILNMKESVDASAMTTKITKTKTTATKTTTPKTTTLKTTTLKTTTPKTTTTPTETSRPVSRRCVGACRRYRYKLTDARMSYRDSRSYCRNWGGDLAVHGVKTRKARRALIETMSIVFDFWIGLDDMESESNWIWVNGQPADTSQVGFSTDSSVDFFNTKDCAEVEGSPQNSGLGLVIKDICTTTNYGLCEKRR